MDLQKVVPYKYHSYGLNILSNVPLPDLTPAGFENPNLTIRQGTLTRPSPEILPAGEGCWQATEDEACYFWSDVGGMCVRHGREIIIDPNRSTAITSLALTIQGPGIATALHQRNYLVLHASAFLTETGAVAFVGPSGSGKSTSLSALLDRNYLNLTDDLLIVRPEQLPAPAVLPGPSLIKLWPTVVEAQGRDPASLPSLGQGYLKLVDRFDRQHLPPLVPLRRIYLVVPDEKLKIEKISEPEALMALMTQSYCSEVLRFVGEPRNFAQCASIIRHVSVRRLRRGTSLELLQDLATCVEEDLSSGSQ